MWSTYLSVCLYNVAPEGQMRFLHTDKDRWGGGTNDQIGSAVAG